MPLILLQRLIVLKAWQSELHHLKIPDPVERQCSIARDLVEIFSAMTHWLQSMTYDEQSIQGVPLPMQNSKGLL